jgi:hypothetical protein
MPRKETPEDTWDFWGSDADTRATWTSFGEPLCQRQNKQVAEALGKIEPKPDRRQDCERQTILALRTIEYTKKTENHLLSPGEMKELFLKKAKGLRLTAEVLAKDLSTMPTSKEFSSAAKVKAKAYELSAAQIYVQSNVPTQSKVQAVYWSERLLALFGHHQAARNREFPGLTPDGLWHDLAEILYGVKGSIDFGYLRRERKRQKKLRASQSPFCLLRPGA